MKPITTYMWGYWGWGNHTRKFVRTVDDVERIRGWFPPVFVDIRYSRSVRAKGFRGDEFCGVAGRDLYHWLPSLGNERIKRDSRRNRKKGNGRIKISDPLGAVELLGIIIDADRESRRVIFYCACEEPCDCHRSNVARLLVKAAAFHGIDLTVIEWPGERPRALKLDVEREAVRKALGDECRIPLKGVRPRRLQELAALPWYSRVELRADDERAVIIAGPAKFAAAGWYLPSIGTNSCKSSDTLSNLRKRAMRERKSGGYEPVRHD